MKKNNQFFPKKSLGQNFLIDLNIIKKIINLIGPGPKDSILEIGPGRGALTQHLINSCKRLILIERDQGLAFYIKKKWPWTELILMDARNAPWDRIHEKINKIVGNLPYNIASRLIWDICSTCTNLDLMVFTIQKEVAEKIAAKAGQKKYGLFSAWVQTFCDVELKFLIGPNCFFPRPKVQSQVVILRPKKNIVLDKVAQKRLSIFLKFCFKCPRKQLGNILRDSWNPDIDNYIGMRGFTKKTRPGMLTPKDFYELSRILYNFNR